MKLTYRQRLFQTSRLVTLVLAVAGVALGVLVYNGYPIADLAATTIFMMIVTPGIMVTAAPKKEPKQRSQRSR